MKKMTINFFKYKFIILEIFQCILLLKISFDGDLCFNFDFDNIMTYFEIHIFYSICVIDIMSSLKNPIMNPLFSYNSSIL